MAAIAFDTLKYTKRLREAGVPDKQAEAEAEAEALSEVLEVNWKELATKEDLIRMEERMNIKAELMRAELKKDLAETKAELKRDIGDTKAELTRWILTAGILQTTLLTGLLMKLAHLI